MTVHRSRRALLGELALRCSQVPAQAQNWPTRPVKVFMATAAGSGPDVIARLVTGKLSQMWGQQVLILNWPGAGGLIAQQALATARQPHALSAEFVVARGPAGHAR
jgi:tripartite-type tricarboxylate transporter receptor subunit TctC